MTDSFYDLLGIDPDADEEAILRAYRERLKETHPDVSDDPDADARTKRLLDAKETLLDPAERERYDRIGHDSYAGTGDRSRNADAAPGDPVTDARGWGQERSGGSGPTNDTAGPWERRARERRAEERVGTDDAWADRAAEPAGGPEEATGRAGRRQRARRSDSRFDVDLEPGDVKDRGPWLSMRESPVVSLSLFILYPVMLGGVVFPAFPLWMQLLVATFLVVLIALLQSMPGVGVVVFGCWSVLCTVGIALGGVSPLSLLGIYVVGTTWFPLGLTLLTAWVLRA